MLFAAALSLCTMMPQVVDDIIRLREEQGVTETEFRAAIHARKDMPDQLKFRALSTVTMVYVLPKGSDYWTLKQQIILNCENKETIRGYQYPNQGAGRGARNRSGYEFHRGERSHEARDDHSR